MTMVNQILMGATFFCPPIVHPIVRSIDFRDVIEASKHVVNKQQTSRFGVILLIYYDKNILQNTDIVERIVRKLINSQSKFDRECS